MKTLMTASAIVALVSAMPALAQQDPTMSEPPAAAEPAPLPETAPEIMSPDPGMSPDAGAAVEAPKDNSQAPTSAEIFIPQQEPDDILASSLIGSTVENPAGEALGSINDVVLSDAGAVDAVVIGVGGFLGIGEKSVGVNFDAIEETADENGNIILVLNATAEELEAAPQYVTVAALRQQEEMQAPAAAPPPASSVPTQ